MSTKDPHLLTPDRLADLRLLANGAHRKNGRLWECSRGRLAWLAREGYVELGPYPPPHHGERRRAQRTVTVTEKGLQAIAAADALAKYESNAVVAWGDS